MSGLRSAGAATAALLGLSVLAPWLETTLPLGGHETSNGLEHGGAVVAACAVLALAGALLGRWSLVGVCGLTAAAYLVFTTATLPGEATDDPAIREAVMQWGAFVGLLAAMGVTAIALLALKPQDEEGPT